MVIGQYILVGTINDDTRSKAVLNILLSAGLKKIPEESVKEIIIFPGEKGIYTSLHQLAGADVDNSRAYLPDSLYYSILPWKYLISPA
jgi:hypothetical protein